jgi:hypothetical protein
MSNVTRIKMNHHFSGFPFIMLCTTVSVHIACGLRWLIVIVWLSKTALKFVLQLQLL